MKLQKNHSLNLVAGALVLLLATGCSLIPSVGPDYETPKINLPAQWMQASAAEQTAVTAELSSWWVLFEDTTLTKLIRSALENNFDRRVALSRVREARALRAGAVGGFFPDIDVTGDVQRGESRSTSQAVTTPTGVGVFGATEGVRNIYSVQGQMGWEIDILGGIRRSYEAADANLESLEASYRDVVIALTGDVAQNYIDLLSLKERRRLARRNIEAQNNTLELVQARFDAGLVSELDVAQARAQLEQTRSALPVLEQAMVQVQSQIAVLVGTHPARLEEEHLLLAQTNSLSALIPHVPPSVSVGIPSELLRRRPDIRQAERLLAAQTARIGVAMSDLFPKFSIIGQLGNQARESGSVFNSGSRYWSIGPSVTIPIFHGGEILSNITVQRERTEQLLASYEKAVYQSISETETALSAYHQEEIRRRSLAAAVAANQRAGQLSQDLYREGLADFLRVLNSDQAIFASEDALVQSEQATFRNLINLYRSVSGPIDETVVSVITPAAL